jgi:hypothetical protein
MLSLRLHSPSRHPRLVRPPFPALEKKRASARGGLTVFNRIGESYVGSLSGKRGRMLFLEIVDYLLAYITAEIECR